MTQRMTCRELIEDFLAAYVDDELLPEIRDRFDEHLGQCPACVSYLETYRQTMALARAASHAEPLDDPAPPPLVEAILAALQK
ncbi:anti-sigma factor family protein [Paraliomyxa miuraensis]|uniref:anti-sigma factor family protein n=1 Tax=Paraliomyxa miuraensis TaxID=376150 RepID=UPI00225A1D5C|nr:zf-HC2 domain-containing protein [Paraliomyxa miuraensis]MCX4244874.1 zf-HC2 domain-containing protein [Paraliomyxa miuraensis]